MKIAGAHAHTRDVSRSEKENIIIDYCLANLILCQYPIFFFFFCGYQPMKLSILVVVKRQPLELRMGDVDGLWWPHAMSASGGHSFPFLSFTPLKWKKGIVN